MSAARRFGQVIRVRPEAIPAYEELLPGRGQP